MPARRATVCGDGAGWEGPQCSFFVAIVNTITRVRSHRRVTLPSGQHATGVPFYTGGRLVNYFGINQQLALILTPTYVELYGDRERLNTRVFVI